MQATLPLELTINSQENLTKSPVAPATDSASVEIHSCLAARDLSSGRAA
ncbi:MAG: hypothetical protein ABIU29_03345 [Chthoniobacterales bacterium]